MIQTQIKLLNNELNNLENELSVALDTDGILSRIETVAQEIEELEQDDVK